MEAPPNELEIEPSKGPPLLGRAAFYVDGFNFYHALSSLELHENHYKWLDWQRLAKIIAGSTYQVVKVVFCTASPKHKMQDVQDRHRNYLDALTATGIEVRSGWFLGEPQECRSCGASWTRYNEKEGDVSLALSLIEDAYADVYDIAFLVSSDSDQVPTLRLMKKRFGPGSANPKQVIAVFPAWRGEDATSRSLSSHASDNRRIGKPMLGGSLLPRIVKWQVAPNKLRLIRRPELYDPPNDLGKGLLRPVER